MLLLFYNLATKVWKHKTTHFFLNKFNTQIAISLMKVAFCLVLLSNKNVELASALFEKQTK